ncbi:hypothetical protein DZD18_14425 [Rhodobacteraceae bacterium W635]|uniref:hypothetical protein n=1 Tax=Nioella halotolerans TaxID=2303578 RepID=UPI000E3BBA38|nr:hypothetical protein DZD18_14425 [Rhodobacteraceae bacterium W635]
MSRTTNFIRNESGAVTVDWVVLTAATVGLGLATMAVVSAGVEDLSGDMRTQMESQTISASFGGGTGGSWDWSGSSAQDYYDIGAAQAPGNNGATYNWAHQEAIADAPEGFNFANPLVDPDTGNVVYTSDDGQYYASGGEIHPVAEYAGTPVYWGA